MSMRRPPVALICLLTVTVLFYGCTRLATTPPASAEPAEPPPMALQPAVRTEPLDADADDPAFWLHPTDPAKSLIIGTNKVEADKGKGLAVFDMQGKLLQEIGDLDRPNNVDVEYGLRLAGETIDIAVCAERYQERLRVFRIDPDKRQLVDISSPEQLKVFQGEKATPERAVMGVGLYRRPADGALFAICSRKSGPPVGYLWEYRLEDNGEGRVKATKVRELGSCSPGKEIEAVLVDDALGYVYYAEEGAGIHKWRADPDHPDAGVELAIFGTAGFEGDREGIGLYALDNGTGYIVCTDQLSPHSEYHVYKRAGEPGNPNDHEAPVKVVAGGADETDGIDVVSTPVGDTFPQGILVAMNSQGKNFFVYDWRDIAAAGGVRLQTGTPQAVR